MADVYEIAQETAKAIEASRRFRASMTDDVEDEAREWPPIYHVCRALLAQRAVVEAAEAQEEAYAKVRACDWGTVERDDLLHEAKRCASATGAAVRAMKEQTR